MSGAEHEAEATKGTTAVPGNAHEHEAAQSGHSTTRRLIDPRLPLLYLCASSDTVSAMRKAFAVLSQSESYKARLSAEQVTMLMYPHGTASGARIFKVPYSREQIEGVVAQVGSKAAADGHVGVTADQLVYSVYGARLLAACGTRYVLRDVLLDMWRVLPADAAV